MFRHILLPTDGSELSDTAVQQGVRFAKSIGAKVTGLCVMPSQDLFFTEGMSRESYLELPVKRRKEAKELAEAYLSRVVKAAEEAGVKYNVVVEMFDQP